MDKLAPIRQISEMLVENCKKNYTQSEFVTIDDMLVAFRGRAPFRQYIPSKPAKFGIKIHAMCGTKMYSMYVTWRYMQDYNQRCHTSLTKSKTHHCGHKTYISHLWVC